MEKSASIRNIEQNVNLAEIKLKKKQVILIKEKSLIKDLRHLMKELKDYAR